MPGASPRDRLARHPVLVAPELLGARLRSTLGATEPVVVRITEVEAYGGVGEDPGSHAHRRRTPRNAVMFGEVGHAYVYFTYGMHWCLNVVAHEPGVAGGVLIRAGAVEEGRAVALARRTTARSDRELARGPARLAATLGVTGADDGIDLLDPGSPLSLTLPGPVDRGPHAAGPRTGVAGDGAATPWRFWLVDEPSVSPHRAAAPRSRS
ncbi:MAG: DNA-3-methyladenine glycosylase [Candidatus Nanopelagicales bacterium]|jgi:DNA-3-methyladenine glycosylase|nr:DNA-3-methyladenine glycosylase [Candidatus Nanopelagicales bacterium]